MKAITTVNGIPAVQAKPCEKVDFNRARDLLKEDPHHQLVSLGFTDKEAYVIEVSLNWEGIKAALQDGVTKEQILALVN